MSNDYEQHWRDRARLMQPRFKNYGILCEVHHGEYGAAQKKLALAIMCTKIRREADVCAMPGCGKPSVAPVVPEGEWWCAEHAAMVGGAK